MHFTLSRFKNLRTKPAMIVAIAGMLLFCIIAGVLYASSKSSNLNEQAKSYPAISASPTPTAEPTSQPSPTPAPTSTATPSRSPQVNSRATAKAVAGPVQPAPREPLSISLRPINGSLIWDTDPDNYWPDGYIVKWRVVDPTQVVRDTGVNLDGSLVTHGRNGSRMLILDDMTLPFIADTSKWGQNVYEITVCINKNGSCGAVSNPRLFKHSSSSLF